MGDALCGPSNALQNFQKHTSVDRTLQQDRLTSRQSPGQGFRSQNPQEGILDPEFAAFEANLAGPALPDLQHAPHFAQTNHVAAHHPAAHHPAAHHPAAHHPANSSWASDFQNLQISGPAHPVQLQRPNIAPATANGGWHTEFMRQQPGHVPQAQQNPQMHGAYQPSFAPNYPMYGSMNQMQPSQVMPSQQKPVEQFDESAFEAAFDQARADMELQGADQKDTQHNLEDSHEYEPVTEDIRLGSDLIPQSEKQDPQTKGRDADELARTAGQLLDSVRNEQSEKFAQSNFLALMRRIRDREVEVEGDEFRETAHSLHPGGRYYPGQHPPSEEIRESRPTQEGISQPPTPGHDTPYEPLEGFINSQGLVDRRSVPFCFLNRELEAHFLH